jgi:hypothetical protein
MKRCTPDCGLCTCAGAIAESKERDAAREEGRRAGLEERLAAAEKVVDAARAFIHRLDTSDDVWDALRAYDALRAKEEP